MKALLEVKSLVKHFPIIGSRLLVRAVNGISFSITEGETLALVGESGSGKTTVGRCILGLETPTSGSIYFQGLEINKHRHIRSKDLRGRVQFVFQEPAEALDPRMCIGDSIEEPLRAEKVPVEERKRKVAEVIGRVGLSADIVDQYPAELSAGQQQRAGIARAIITEPSLIVLDEPTSALDPTARAEIIDLLISIQKELKTSYLFISHDLNTVRYISHRVAIMYLGMIVEQGEAATVFARPRHPYSVGLLSSVLLPNPRLRRQTSVSLQGEIPSPINLPDGCYLASRCPFKDDQCKLKIPSAQNVGNGHLVHCPKHEQIIAVDHTIDTFEEFQREAEEILGASVEENGGDLKA